MAHGLDIELTDTAMVDEIDLLTELMALASATPTRLDLATVDEVLSRSPLP